MCLTRQSQQHHTTGMMKSVIKSFKIKTKMSTKKLLFELLYGVLIEIREEAVVLKSNKIKHLTDLFHNLPSELENENNSYDDILKNLISKSSENKNLQKWLEDNIERLSK